MQGCFGAGLDPPKASVSDQRDRCGPLKTPALWREILGHGPKRTGRVQHRRLDQHGMRGSVVSRRMPDRRMPAKTQIQRAFIRAGPDPSRDTKMDTKRGEQVGL